ncbi:MAG: sigma-70 family RNA polymerase sigma factor [Phycisphaerae bacterium]
MSRTDDLRRYVESAIPSRMTRVVSADDILQDIWITVVRSASDIIATGSEGFDAWLTRIAQRRIADAIRRARAVKRGGRARITYEKPQTSSFVDLFARISSPQATPSKTLSARESTNAVQVALAALPERHRAVLMLRYFDGKSHSDIAHALNLSQSAVNSLLFRGMQKLRRLLGATTQFFSDDRLWAASARPSVEPIS